MIWYILQLKDHITQKEETSMKLYTFFAYIFFTITHTTHSYIVESSTVETVLEYIDGRNTLVIFDLDNTLMHPYGELGSDEWFSYLLTEKMKEGFTLDQACTAILPYYYYAQHYLNAKLTETSVPSLIKNLIDHHIDVIALTARSPYLSEITHEQLERLGIRFLLGSTYIAECVLPLPYPCLYRYNMLFVSNNDKGEALRCLLDILGRYYTKIIFVDDKLKYCYSIETALSDVAEICCIRYSGCDNLVASFDPIKAQEQFHALQMRNRMQA